jgi:hypothetical protein
MTKPIKSILRRSFYSVSFLGEAWRKAASRALPSNGSYMGSTLGRISSSAHWMRVMASLMASPSLRSFSVPAAKASDCSALRMW